MSLPNLPEWALHPHLEPFTQLRDQASFHTEIDRAVSYAHQTGTPLALAYADIDNLKTVNDVNSMAAGDWLIQSTGSIVLDRASMAYRLQRKQIAPAYRLGGDEFGLILPHDIQAGTLAINGLRSTYSHFIKTLGTDATTRNAPDIRKAQVGLSIGLAVLRPGMKTGELKSQANTALVRDKNSRRDERMARLDGDARREINEAMKTLKGHGLSRGDIARLLGD